MTTICGIFGEIHMKGMNEKALVISTRVVREAVMAELPILVFF